jgi:ubiquinone/menaquinone biosynthesis C-methylase UbiE
MTRHPSFFEGTEMPTAGWWEVLWPDPAGVLAKAGAGPGIDVVDLCCGDGWFTLQIARVARHVVAIDIDPDLIEVARVRLSENGATNCEFRVADAYELRAVCPRPVDFVFMANAFHGVADRLRLSRAIHAVLKPSGRLAILNWHQRRREETMVLGEPRGPRAELRMSPDETIASVTEAGLNPLQIAEVPPYHYAIIFERPAG